MSATQATAYARQDFEKRSAKWWVLLLTGLIWVVVGVLVLDADLDSALTIGYLVGGYLIAAGVMEFVLIGVTEGWKWLHAVLGVLLVGGGVAAFTEPFQTFTILAALVGFFLVLKGAVDFIVALASRHDGDLWWVMLIASIAEIAVGVWASGYPGRSATLLVLWVGLGALVRGIIQIVLAFQVRNIHGAVTA